MIGFVIGFLLGFILIPSDIRATHSSWMDKYTDETGIPCCGDDDCELASVRMLAELPEDRVLIEVNGRQITEHRRAVHPSEKQNAYVCRWIYMDGCRESYASSCIRCVFVVTGW